MLSARGFHNRVVRDGHDQQSVPGMRWQDSKTPFSFPRSGVSNKLRALQAEAMSMDQHGRIIST
jgi:hypothetical protein